MNSSSWCKYLALLLYLSLPTSAHASSSESATTDAANDSEDQKQTQVEDEFSEEMLWVHEELDWEVTEKTTTVASKQAESVTEAPGTITVYSQRDISSSGYYTLSELAKMTSGYSSYQIYGEKVFETRGQKAGSFENNKHLLLIDGIPINHARANKAHTEEELPLYFAKSVEFLKGPASALYGASAFLGVINILPKTPTRDGFHLESALSLGSLNESTRVMTNAFYRTKHSATRLSLGYFSKNSSLQFAGTNREDTWKVYDRQDSTFLNLTHSIAGGSLRGLTFGLTSLNTTGGGGEYWTTFSSPENEIRWNTIVPYLKYTRPLTTNLRLNSYLKGNISIENGHVVTTLDPEPSFNDYDITTKNLEWMGELEYRWTDTSRALWGVNIDSRYALNYLVEAGQARRTRSDRYDTFSTYLQLSEVVGFLSGLHLTGGLRVDHGQSSTNDYLDLSPRVAIVQRISPALSFKLLAGHAIRAPGIKEVGVNKEATANLRNAGFSPSAIKTLNPETIDTYEGSIIYSSQELTTSLTGFLNQTFKTLDNRRRTYSLGDQISEQNVFSNTPGRITTRGVEMDALITPSRFFRIGLNTSYATSTDQQGQELVDIPDVKSNISLQFNVPILHLSGFALGHWVHGYRNGNSEEVPFEGYQTLDFKLATELSNYLRAELHVKNALDLKYKFPRNAEAVLPIARRSITLTVNSSF